MIVKSGDVIKITPASWIIWAFVVLFVGMLLVSPLSGMTRLMAIVFIVIIYLLLHQVFNAYELTKVTNEE